MDSKGLSYKGEKTREISFPLGGIGSGCIGLSGNGRLTDWEIYNRPNKQSRNGFTHFAVKAEDESKVIDARVLQGDFLPPYTGISTNSFGFGVEKDTLAGIPHFSDVEFVGQFPFAVLTFKDDFFPGIVKMTAFNPFIPLNDKDSSIPGAFFEIEVCNSTNVELTYAVCLSVSNPLFKEYAYNVFSRHKKNGLIHLCCDKYDKEAPEYGDISVATDADDISYQEYWYRGIWFDVFSTFWDDFSKVGKLKNRTYSRTGDGNLHFSEDTCSIAVHFKVAPGKKQNVRFVITWNFPNCYNYWNPQKCSCRDDASCVDKNRTWKNYYATIFKSSVESAVYSLSNWDRLYDDTLLFKNSLFESTFPVHIINAISANISILKTPTALRLEDGSFYGWEGCGCKAGCCEGSCTHVWNYAYALPFLFPSLERSIRSLDYKYNQREDGRMSFRLQLPLERERFDFRACADGQFGGVIKAYCDWKISGDNEWLKSIWGQIKKSVEFAWAETNEDKWDFDKDGVLEGRQHHTLDMELFGPNSWLTGFYLAALKAASEIAMFFGEREKAAEYMELFRKGKKWVNEHLFNGQYFQQQIDLKDKSIIDPFKDGGSVIGIPTEQAYWNDEKGEIKFQIGRGCGIDQVIAQWHANICGLGNIFDKRKTIKALRSIYKYNYKRSFRNFFNPCRLYALNDEAGVVICTWPDEKLRPITPAPYSDECWSGCEYQIAAHMIQEGLVNEGVEIVQVVRSRYDGEKRNPWNEFECGSNYARSMSSYSLLLALSGFEFDMVNKVIGFNPVLLDKKPSFKCFWSLDGAWGTFEVNMGTIILKVLKGSLSINLLKLPFLKGEHINNIVCAQQYLNFEDKKGSILFYNTVTIKEDDAITIQVL